MDLDEFEKMRCFLTAAIGLLLLGGVAASQPLRCSVKGSSLKFRAESVTDLLGDVTFRCDPGPQPVSGQPYITGDLTIFLNTSLSNRIGVAGAASTTDAVLIANENNASPPSSISTLGPSQTAPGPQYGLLCGGNCLKWSGVKIPNPGATAPDGSSFQSPTILRITNLRANPSQLGFSNTGPVSIVLFGAGIADAAKVQIVDPQPELGSVQQGLIVKTTSATLCQDLSLNIVNGAVNGPPTFTVGLTEGFEYAFRPLGKPTSAQGVPAGESSYPTPGVGANNGGANQGTRFLIRFSNIGNGVRLAVPGTITQGSLTVQLVQGLDANGNGGGTLSISTGLIEIQAAQGASQAVYEVTASDNTQLESIQVPVTVGYTADPGSNRPAPGTTTVNASFAPLTTIGTPSSTASIPRFIDSSVARSVFTISRSCPPLANVTRLVPNSAPAGAGTDLTLGVAGTGFGFGSVVEFNGTALNTELTSDLTGLFATVPAKLLATPATVQVDVLNPDGRRSNSLPFTITGASGPVISPGGVVSAANNKAPVTRGSLVSIYGTSLSGTTQSAPSLPLPIALGSTQVRVNGVPAPLIFISSAQINFQMPFEVPLAGTAAVTVTRDGNTSPPVSVALAEFAPGIFRSGAQPIVLHGADNSLVTASKPAANSEILVIYGTGIGGLNTLPVTGAATPGNPLVMARINPTATVGSQTADVLFAGLVAGFVGLAQFNVRMPANLPTSATQLPLVLAFGTASDSVPIAAGAASPSQQLTVDLADVLPHSLLLLDNLHFEYTVRNPGHFSGTLTHTLFVSKNPQPTVSDQVIDSADASQSATDLQFIFDGIPLPDSVTTPGRYYVAVGINVKGDTDPSHIILSQPFPLDVIAQRPPFDLAVTLRSISPTTVAAGSPIVVSYSVQEPTGLSGTFFRSVYIGPKSTVTTNDTLINTRTFDLIRGSFTVDSTNNTIPATLPPGNYFVAVILQNDGDTNSANNTSVALPITVKAPAQASGSESDQPPQRAETARPGLRPAPSVDQPEP